MTRTYGALARAGDGWVIRDLEPHVAIRFKAFFPRVPKASAGPFKLHGDHATAADLHWFMQRYPLRAEDAVLAALTRDKTGYEAAQAEVGRIMAPDYAPPGYAGLQPGQSVRLHQARTVELMQRFRGVLCGDDMGEGKTYTGGACCLVPGALPATIVCPPNLRGQWVDKLRAFTTLDVHAVIGTKPYNLPPSDVRIIGYTQLEGWVDLFEMMGAGFLGFDEIHELRHGEETAKGQAAARLASLARYVVGFSGTPIFNYGEEIWNIMALIRPDLLGPREDFQREWCRGREVKDPEALGSYLREQHALVRKKGSGPPPNVIVETIGHDVQVLESVELLAHRLAHKAVSGAFMERGQAVRELDLMMRMQTGIAKAKAVAAFVRILVEGGEPVILFGWHREVYEIWMAELNDLGVVMYTGSETPTQKDAAKRAFLEGGAQVFIMSLRSGAGVDGLQARCKTVVFGELDWSPAMHGQCIGRVNREGQACWPEPVTAIYLVADDGSDPPMQDTLGIKASQAHSIVDPGMGPQRVERDTRPIEALIARYLERRAA
jgi:hypothetical protein